MERLVKREIDAYQMALMSGVHSEMHAHYHNSVEQLVTSEAESARLHIILEDIRCLRTNDDEDEDDGSRSSTSSPRVPSLVHRLHTGHSYCLADFVTGNVEINRSIFNRHADDDMRWKYLFATDHII